MSAGSHSVALDADAVVAGGGAGGRRGPAPRRPVRSRRSGPVPTPAEPRPRAAVLPASRPGPDRERTGRPRPDHGRARARSGSSSSSGTSTKRRVDDLAVRERQALRVVPLVAEQQEVDVERPRAVADVGGVAGHDAAALALDGLARVEQRLGREPGVDLQAGVEERPLVEHLADGLGLVDGRGGEDLDALAAQRRRRPPAGGRAARRRWSRGRGSRSRSARPPHQRELARLDEQHAVLAPQLAVLLDHPAGRHARGEPGPHPGMVAGGRLAAEVDRQLQGGDDHALPGPEERGRHERVRVTQRGDVVARPRLRGADPAADPARAAVGLVVEVELVVGDHRGRLAASLDAAGVLLAAAHGRRLGVRERRGVGAPGRADRHRLGDVAAVLTDLEPDERGRAPGTRDLGGHARPPRPRAPTGSGWSASAAAGRWPAVPRATSARRTARR